MAEWILYSCAEVIIPWLASETVKRIGKVLGGKQGLLVPEEIRSLKIWLARFGYIAHLLEGLLEYIEADDLRRPPHQKIGYDMLRKLIKEIIVDTKKQHSQIMLTQPLPTVKKSYSLLCEKEKQRGLVEEKILDQSHFMNVKSEKIPYQSHAMNVKSEKISDQSNAMNGKSEKISDQSHAMNIKSKKIPNQSHAMNVKSEKISDQSHDMNGKSEKILDQYHAMNIKSKKIPDQSHVMNVKSNSPSPRQDSSQTWTSGSSKTQRFKKQLHCTYCGGRTHTVKWCFYLNGFPIWHYLHGKDVQPPNRGVTRKGYEKENWPWEGR